MRHARVGEEANAHFQNSGLKAMAQAEFRRFLTLIGRDPVLVVDFGALD